MGLNTTRAHVSIIVYFEQKTVNNFYFHFCMFFSEKESNEVKKKVRLTSDLWTEFQLF